MEKEEGVRFDLKVQATGAPASTMSYIQGTDAEGNETMTRVAGPVPCVQVKEAVYEPTGWGSSGCPGEQVAAVLADAVNTTPKTGSFAVVWSEDGKSEKVWQCFDQERDAGDAATLLFMFLNSVAHSCWGVWVRSSSSVDAPVSHLLPGTKYTTTDLDDVAKRSTSNMAATLFGVSP